MQLFITYHSFFSLPEYLVKRRYAKDILFCWKCCNKIGQEVRAEVIPKLHQRNDIHRRQCVTVGSTVVWEMSLRWSRSYMLYIRCCSSRLSGRRSSFSVF